LGLNGRFFVLLSPTERAQRALHSQPSPKAQRTTPIDFLGFFFIFFGRHVGGSKNRTRQFHPKKKIQNVTALDLCVTVVCLDSDKSKHSMVEVMLK